MDNQIPLPVVPLHNPLSTDDEAVLDNILHVHSIVADVLARAKDCGMDVQNQIERNANHHLAATKFKQRFFPISLKPPPLPGGDT